MITRELGLIKELYQGSHAPDGQMCLLEAVAYIAGEPWSDAPECVCPVLAAFGRAWNDGMRSNEERAQLLPYIPSLIGTKSTPEVELTRSYMAFNWLIRIHLVAWLRLGHLDTHADTLEALSEIRDPHTFREAMPAVRAARDAAWAVSSAAAWAAAWAAARAAAWDAARDAAWAVSRDAAWAVSSAAASAAAWDAASAAAWAAAWAGARAVSRDAAWAAARDAAWAVSRDAAWAAAWDAARDALEPTVVSLQASTHTLFQAMISVGSEAEVTNGTEATDINTARKAT